MTVKRSNVLLNLSSQISLISLKSHLQHRRRLRLSLNNPHMPIRFWTKNSQNLECVFGKGRVKIGMSRDLRFEGLAQPNTMSGFSYIQILFLITTSFLRSYQNFFQSTATPNRGSYWLCGTISFETISKTVWIND